MAKSDSTSTKTFRPNPYCICSKHVKYNFNSSNTILILLCCPKAWWKRDLWLASASVMVVVELIKIVSINPPSTCIAGDKYDKRHNRKDQSEFIESR